MPPLPAPIPRATRRPSRWNRAIRWLTFGASALIATLALIIAGFDPGKWYARWHDNRPKAAPPVVNTVPVVPHAALPSRTAAATKLLPGAQSSTSPTPQGLVLTGIILGRNAKDGYAMLGVARENPQTYSAGALLANGARLAEIHAKYVVLERDGHSVRLYLEGTGLQPESGATVKPLLTIGGNSAPRTATATSTEPLTDYLRPTPLYDGATLVGYQVYPGAKPGAFLQTGLQAGDVITAIDGAPLSDTAQAPESLRRLMDGNTHTATVNRKGSSVEVSLDGSSWILGDRERAKDRESSGKG